LASLFPASSSACIFSATFSPASSLALPSAAAPSPPSPPSACCNFHLSSLRYSASSASPRYLFLNFARSISVKISEQFCRGSRRNATFFLSLSNEHRRQCNSAIHRKKQFPFQPQIPHPSLTPRPLDHDYTFLSHAARQIVRFPQRQLLVRALLHHFSSQPTPLRRQRHR